MNSATVPSRLANALLGMFGLAGVAACHPTTPAQEPIPLIDQMCCKVANAELTQFAGCREDHRSCEDDEPIWIRGAVTCTEVRGESCLNGRCCQYRPQYGTEDGVLTWEPVEAESSGGAEEGPANSDDEPTPPSTDASEAATKTPDEAPSEPTDEPGPSTPEADRDSMLTP